MVHPYAGGKCCLLAESAWRNYEYRSKETLIHSPAPVGASAYWLLAKLTLKDELRVVNIAPLCLFASFALLDEIP